MINSLQDLKISIHRTFIISFTTIFILSLLFLTVMHFKFKANEKIANNYEMEKAFHIYQSTISQKLGIIASSNAFLDYLHSGEYTRAYLLPSFLKQLHFLNEASIVGMEIHDTNEKLIFESGTKSPDFVTLKLCYLNNQLNNRLGSCTYLWRLHFSRTAVEQALHNINHNINTCVSCSPKNFLYPFYFGNFLIQSQAPLPLNLSLQQKTTDFFYWYTLILSLMLILFAIWNKLKVKSIFNNAIAQPLEHLTGILRKNGKLVRSKNQILEVNYLMDQIELWKSRFEEIQQQKEQAALGKLAIQVAHDIRSPLTVLEIFLRDLSTLPPQQRGRIYSAINQIRHIADELLIKYRLQFQPANIIQPEFIEKSLAILLENVVLEKRIEYADRDIEFIDSFSLGTFNSFAFINPHTMQRALSNLINNAVEAINEKGVIKIELTQTNSHACITIEDNGCGIQPEQLSKILEGKSFNKQNGSGLGISSAIETIKKHQGTFSIVSQLNQGTTITIKLPLCAPPRWFLSTLLLKKNMTLVIVDDEHFMHEIWHTKIQSLGTIANSIHVISLYSPDELIKQFPLLDCSNIYFLIDYNFKNFSMNGLELIEKLSIAKLSTLVTNKYQHFNVQEKSLQLGIKILPKKLVKQIPVNVIESEPDLLFLDDDVGLTQAWEAKYRCEGKKIAVFNHVDELMSVLHSYRYEIPIYIDSQLGNGIKGENIAKEIYAKGFKNIYLATGYDSSTFPDLPWIKAIVSKDPP